MTITWRPARLSEDPGVTGVLWVQRWHEGREARFRTRVEPVNWRPPEGSGWILLYERVEA